MLPLLREGLADNSPMVRLEALLGMRTRGGGDVCPASLAALHDRDTHVVLLLSLPGSDGRSIKFPVQTMQVAPTILRVLGLDPRALKSVQVEKTPVLPGFRFDPNLALE